MYTILLVYYIHSYTFYVHYHYYFYSVGFKPLTVLKLAKQLLQRLHTLSVYNIVHGDIQPGNMLLGTLYYPLFPS